MPRLWQNYGMAKVRVSTTVDATLLEKVRALAPGSSDASLLEQAFRALLAARRRVDIDAAYLRAYAAHPLNEPDEWGDLESFSAAAAAS